jgi:hypothetical protein
MEKFGLSITQTLCSPPEIFTINFPDLPYGSTFAGTINTARGIIIPAGIMKTGGLVRQFAVRLEQWKTSPSKIVDGSMDFSVSTPAESLISIQRCIPEALYSENRCRCCAIVDLGCPRLGPHHIWQRIVNVSVSSRT